MPKNAEKIKPRRVIAFVIAFVLAVASFTYGVVRLGRKEPGYHEVEVNMEALSDVYDAGLTLMYYADGSANEIKRTLNNVGKVYTEALLEACKLLDAENEYAGIVNIASINRAPGEKLTLDEALFSVLTDACAKTREGKGFSMFSGALFSEWQTLLYLENPQDFDPAINEDERERISGIASETANPEHFIFTMEDERNRVVSFQISDGYRAFLKENEIDAPVLNLGRMRGAYLMQMVEARMTAAGYTKGYLVSRDGLVSDMETLGEREFPVYGLENGKVSEIARIASNSPARGWQFVAQPFTENEYGYYSVQTDGGVLYRHPYYDELTGEFSDVLFSAELVSDELSAADIQYVGLRLCGAKTQEEADDILREANVLSAYTLLRPDGKIHVPAECVSSVRVPGGGRSPESF